MSRRVSLPGADELFRTTGGRGLQASTPRQHANGETPGDSADRPLRPVPAPAGPSAAEEPEAAEEAPVQESAAPAEAAEHTGRESETAPAARPVPEQASPAGQPGRRTLQPPAGSPGAAPAAPQPVQPAQQQPRRKSGRAPRRPSGRERHDEKITVYVSAEELMDLEHARLVLRGEHGLAVDRGRIVREAVAVVLADLESRGDASILVRRLRGR
ncbi:hypothetical protein ACFWVC_32485 [Streptomyces sp. NPDC058691]|uniref:hypothetical protein n=1 Tax=Streptomyces sp. NPDC058691 TaxID=3346601 RepID=UPI0036623B22